MLEGLEISEIDFSFVEKNLEQRIDPEFYSKKYLKVLENVGKGKNLSTLADTYELHSNGAFKQIFNILHKDNSNDIKYIRSNNVGDFFIEGELEYISEYAHSNLPKTKTVLGDIITARTGKVGGASVVTQDWVNCNSNQNVVNIRIKNSDVINPYYLTTYLNTEYGIIQFEKSSTGNVQPWLNLSLLRRVKIVLLNTPFQEKIEILVKQAHSCII